MKETVNITIAGVTGSGKSRLAFMIKELLSELGFEVDLVLNEDHPTIKNFDNVMSDELDKAIEVIMKKSKIVIEEKQLQRVVPLEMGEMIRFWIEHHGLLDLDTPEEDIINFYVRNQPDDSNSTSQ